MRSSTALIPICFLAWAAATQATQYIVNNHCLESKWYWLANSTTTTGPYNLPSGTAFQHPIIGVGNAFTVVSNATTDIWSATPKAALASSIGDDGMLYWDLNNFTGDPMVNSVGGPQSIGIVTVGEGCDVGAQEGYSGVVHVCGNAEGGAELVMDFC